MALCMGRISTRAMRAATSPKAQHGLVRSWHVPVPIDAKGRSNDLYRNVEPMTSWRRDFVFRHRADPQSANGTPRAWLASNANPLIFIVFSYTYIISKGVWIRRIRSESVALPADGRRPQTSARNHDGDSASLHRRTARCFIRRSARESAKRQADCGFSSMGGGDYAED